MRLPLAVLVLSACLPTRLATPASGPFDPRPQFPIESVSAPVLDRGAFQRVLQVATVRGFRPTVVDAQAGLLVLDRSEFDFYESNGATDGLRRFRMLKFTVVISPTAATLTPQVVMCVESACGARAEWLLDDEQAHLEALVRAATGARERQQNSTDI
jgi:hypothetical protein